MVPGDLDFLAAMLGHPEVNRHYERSFTRADSEAWLERQRTRYERDGHGLWLVSLRGEGTPVGQVGLCMQEVEGEVRPEIGWLLHRPFWGHGYATEAAAATRDLAFARWRYPEVISLIRPVNEPSQRVALRIGMRPSRRAPFHGFEHIVFAMSLPPPAAPSGPPTPA